MRVPKDCRTNSSDGLTHLHLFWCRFPLSAPRHTLPFHFGSLIMNVSIVSHDDTVKQRGNFPMIGHEERQGGSKTMFVVIVSNCGNHQLDNLQKSRTSGTILCKRYLVTVSESIFLKLTYGNLLWQIVYCLNVEESHTVGSLPLCSISCISDLPSLNWGARFQSALSYCP